MDFWNCLHTAQSTNCHQECTVPTLGLSSVHLPDCSVAPSRSKPSHCFQLLWHFYFFYIYGNSSWSSKFVYSILSVTVLPGIIWRSEVLRKWSLNFQFIKWLFWIEKGLVNNTGLCCKWQFARALYLSLWGTGVIFALHTINDKVICWEKDLLIMTLSHILFPLVSNSRVHFLKCCINLLPPSNFYTLHPCSKYYFVQRLWRC